MNVYDFDGTIYAGDSTVDFFLFALKRNPSLVRCLPRQLHGFALYFFRRIDKTRLKECFFSFLKELPTAQTVEAFWAQNRGKICPWYLAQREPEDVVISASPEFLLLPVCRELGIRHLIASRVDAGSGRFTGKNCHGEEKVRRFRAEFGTAPIDRFYSDSPSDAPLARLAGEAFLVQKGTVQEWNVPQPEVFCHPERKQRIP